MDDEEATRANIDRTQQARADETELSERDLADAQRSAQVAADTAQLVERELLDEIVRLHAEFDKVEIEARDVRQAGVSGAIIEQAAGIIMAAVGCTADEALAHLLAQSQRVDVEVASVAQALINSVQSTHQGRLTGQQAPFPSTASSIGPQPVAAHLVDGEIAGTAWLPMAAGRVDGCAAPRAAREIVRSALSSIVDAPVLDDVLLVTSEIVTNSVQYASGPYVVSIYQNPQSTRFRIGVTDTSDTELPEPQLPDLASEHGRGLHIVTTLAPAWGWTRSPSGGKEVWFETGAGDSR